MAVGENTVRLVVLLPKATRDTFEKLAKENGRSMSNYAAHLIEKEVEKVKKN